MSRPPAIRPKILSKIAEKLGFVLDRQKGSHAVYIRSDDHRRIVIPMHNKDLKPGTLRGIVADMGITLEEFVKLL